MSPLNHDHFTDGMVSFLVSFTPVRDCPSGCPLDLATLVGTSATDSERTSTELESVLG